MSLQINDPNGAVISINKYNLCFGGKDLIAYFHIDKLIISPASDENNVGSVTIITVFNKRRSFEYFVADSGMIDHLEACVREANSSAQISYSDNYSAASREEKDRIEQELDAQRKSEKQAEAASKKEEERRKVFEESAREWKERQEKAQRKNREKATEQLEKVISLNEGIQENKIARRLKETAYIFEKWADYAFIIILAFAVIEAIATFIAGIVVSFDIGLGAYLISFPSILVILVLGYLEAVGTKFILKCISLIFLSIAEVVQNTYMSANVALYEANKKTNE